MTTPGPLIGAGGGPVFTGVTMEVATPDGPPFTTPGVAVGIDASGLVLWLPPTGAPASIAWGRIGDAHCGEPGLLLEGAPAVALSATVDGRFVRWLVPIEQMPPERAVALDLLLAGRARPAVAVAYAYGPPGAAPPPVQGPAGAVAYAYGPPGAAPPPVQGPAGAVPYGQPAPRPGRHARRDRSLRARVIPMLWASVAVLVLLGGGLLGTALATTSKEAIRPVDVRAGDQILASQINVTSGDFPSGWTVDRSPSGPLSGFLGPSAPKGKSDLTPSLRKETARITRQFESCLGVSPSKDQFFGAGPSPLAEESSPAYAAPASGPVLEAGSQTMVYGSAAAVRPGIKQLRSPKFPRCFGAAIGTEFLVSMRNAASGSGATYGTPTIQQLHLPELQAAHAAGVDVALPYSAAGKSGSVQLGFVFVGGGRVEATLVTFGTSPGFPASLAGSLTRALEHNIATKGSGTGA